MKDIKEYTIEELQARINELNEIKKNKELDEAKEVMLKINEMLKRMERLGYPVQTWCVNGGSINVECIGYDGVEFWLNQCM